MNVIVSNEQRNTLSGLDIDIIKSTGEIKIKPIVDVTKSNPLLKNLFTILYPF